MYFVEEVTAPHLRGKMQETHTTAITYQLLTSEMETILIIYIYHSHSNTSKYMYK